MAGIKELRLRIKALKNTSKITAAMKMVSAAKLKRAQDAYSRAKPYAERMEETFGRVLAALDAPEHPLLVVREVKRTRYVLVSSDRGLAGAFNNSLFRAFARRPADTGTVQGLGVGRRARDLLARLGRIEPTGIEASNLPTYANAATIAGALTRDFTEGKCDKVVLVYNRFRSVLSQTPVFVPLLPLVPPGPSTHSTSSGQAGSGAGLAASADKGLKDDYIFEPDQDSLFAELLPKLVTLQVFRALLENAVGEHSARMTAMDNATKNTKDLIASMSLTMNRARQAAITRELIEIVSGAEALKG
jgi:F-type H+-transporting ATPase subunit gamma